jgi:serine/threonine protein kinase
MPVAASFPSPGDQIGRFKVLAQLGAGGMGVVYDALEVNLDRRVALKVISPMFADDADFRSRFSSEARALASLDSPNIVQVFAHGEEDGYLYIATQLIPDGDLGQSISKWGPPPMGKAAELMEQVASGLADAHAAGLIHRDIKPGNVMIRRRGNATVQAYLGDFGIARRVDAEVTRVGASAIGTPSYMAPELHGGATAGITTDIYALGCLLWVALVGRPPYEGTSEFEIVGGHVNKPVPQLAGDGPVVEALNRILRVSMAKEPGHRYRQALEMRDDLREVARMTHDPAFHQAATARGAAGSAAPPTALGPRTPTPTPVPTPVPQTPPTPGYGIPAQPVGATYPPPAQPQPFVQHHTPVPAPQQKSRTGLWIGVGVAAAVVVGVAAAIAVASGGDNGGGGGGGGGGNGSGLSAEEQAFVDSDAQSIVDEAEKEMAVLQSVRVTGEALTDGQPGRIDMVITSRGDCDGTISLGGGTAQVRKIDGTAWLKPDQEFLVAGGASESEALATAALIGNRWILGTQEDADGFTDICDIDELLEDDGGDYTFEKGDVGELDGQRVIDVQQTDSGGQAATIEVAVAEPHYVLQLDSAEDDGSYRFSQFDEEFTAQAPADDEVYDPNS